MQLLLEILPVLLLVALLVVDFTAVATVICVVRVIAIGFLVICHLRHWCCWFSGQAFLGNQPEGCGAIPCCAEGVALLHHLREAMIFHVKMAIP